MMILIMQPLDVSAKIGKVNLKVNFAHTLSDNSSDSGGKIGML